MNPNIKHLLKDHAYVNIPLNFEEAYDLGIYAAVRDETAAKQEGSMLKTEDLEKNSKDRRDRKLLYKRIGKR